MKEYIDREKTLALIHDIGGCGAQPDTWADGYDKGVDCAYGIVMIMPTVDAVEVVRCKDCRYAEAYERNDSKTGCYCHFCGHEFTYGSNWERKFSPIKEADDFCSYGERREL